MNPFITVLNRLYNSQYGLAWQGEAGAAVALLQALSLNYMEEDMPEGTNPFRWVRSQLEQFKPNQLIDKIEIDLNADCNR